MPAFVPDGPDVPERLLQAHEEGRVVFFCGAGISYPAGLPGFRDLVDAVYAKIGENRSDVEKIAYCHQRYDETFDLLERRLKDRDKDQLFVRRAVAKALEPKFRKTGAKDTHKALLDLARDEKGVTRLVTTNFDRIFDYVNRKEKLELTNYLAPLLPVPKVTKWDGIVYLHGGLLSKNPTATDLNKIVLSSGDFGLAYLSERWASRFVSELLKNFIICFVGYSIEDPVLRYMMDALAADELLGENKIESFAFASFKAGDRESMEHQWEAKGVVPLLFDQDAGGGPFAVLHQTIQEWARVYTRGTQGKRMIISEHAAFPPKVFLRSDYTLSRMLWALTDPKATQYFADFDPVPPLEWLEPLDEFLFDASDLDRFGVKEKQGDDDKRTFAMLRRPSPSMLSPWMELVSDGKRWTNWDQVMGQLARWLIRHLGNPKLVLWIASRGGRLHPGFWHLVESRLIALKKLEVSGDHKKLLEIIEKNPDGIPSAAMRKLWDLILADRLKRSRDFEFYGWFDRLAVDGWTSGLKSELRDLLRPCVALAKPHEGWGLSGLFDTNEDKESVSSLVRWEVVPATDYCIDAIRDNQAIPNWQTGLHQCLDDFQSLLNEAVELMAYLDQSVERRHLSVYELPSIEDHSQNLGHHDWTVFVSLTRDAWLAMRESDPKKAARITLEWWSSEYTLFKRMALFAASQEGVVGDNLAVEWLLGEDGKWLWDIETKREVLRLLATLSQRWRLSPSSRRTTAQLQLEQAILAGPSLKGFHNDASENDLARFSNRAVWLRLAKLASGNYKLSRSAATRFAKLKNENPNWGNPDDERHELPFWIESGTGEEEIISSPTEDKELLSWLEKHPQQDWHHDDDWRLRSKTQFDSISTALKTSFKNGNWYPSRLESSLYVWAEDKNLLESSWHDIGSFIATLSDDQKKEILNGLSCWMRAGGGVFGGNDELFYSLATDLIRLAETSENYGDRDIMFVAINHPTGHATEAVLKWWSRRVTTGDRQCDGEVQHFLNSICDGTEDSLRMGRVILAQSIGWLYHVDPDWTTGHLVPLFDWKASPDEARACWTGFLYSPRRIPDLLAALKQPFLEIVEHRDDLPRGCRENYARFFTFIALEPAGVFDHGELRSVFAAFEVSDLENAAHALSDAMEAAGEKAETLWREAIHPLIEKIWPKSADKRSGQIAGRFAEICIYANEDFRHAVKELTPYFQETLWSSILLDRLMERDLHRRFPREALELMARVANTSRHYRPDSLRQFLIQIMDVDRGAIKLKTFKHLHSSLE